MTDEERRLKVITLMDIVMPQMNGLVDELGANFLGSLTGFIAVAGGMALSDDNCSVLVVAFTAGVIYERQQQIAIQFNPN